MGSVGSVKAAGAAPTQKLFRGALEVPSDAEIFYGVARLPSKIAENQRWILARNYAVSNSVGKQVSTTAEFEGRGTYGDKNAEIVAANEGFTSTQELRNAYRERTKVKVGDEAWTGKINNGQKVFGRVTKNEYNPVLITLKERKKK